MKYGTTSGYWHLLKVGFMGSPICQLCWWRFVSSIHLLLIRLPQCRRGRRRNNQVVPDICIIEWLNKPSRSDHSPLTQFSKYTKQQIERHSDGPPLHDLPFPLPVQFNSQCIIPCLTPILCPVNPNQETRKDGQTTITCDIHYGTPKINPLRRKNTARDKVNYSGPLSVVGGWLASSRDK